LFGRRRRGDCKFLANLAQAVLLDDDVARRIVAARNAGQSFRAIARISPRMTSQRLVAVV
jgi:hypothetical protein